jgi:hypothetical protein
MLSSTLLDENVRLSATAKRFAVKDWGKDQKLVSQHFDADVGAPAAPGLGTNDNE